MSGGWLWASVVAGLLGAKPQTAPQKAPVQERLLEGTVRTADGKPGTHSVGLDGQVGAKERREIRLSGRVTRAGAPASGLEVNFVKSVSGFELICMSSDSGRFGPMAKTDEDGRFELSVNEPGGYFVCVGTSDGRIQLPRREVDIPDTDVYFVDLAYEEIAVAGIVVDQASGEPIAHARVAASPKDGQGPSWSAETVAGPDGRFQLGAFAEGEGVLRAGAKGYVRGKLEASLPAGGDLRMALTRASTIKGRVVDAEGHGIGGVSVAATEPEDRESGGSSNTSLHDGSFEIGFLSPAPHNLCAGSATKGFAVAGNVSPSEEVVLLTLSPPGRVRLTVRGPDGAPFQGASASPLRVDGLVVGGCSDHVTEPDSAGLSSFKGSDSKGALEVATPIGTVELKVHESMKVRDSMVAIGKDTPKD